MSSLGDRLLAHYEELVADRHPRQYEDAWDDAADVVRTDPEQGWALIADVLERIPVAAVTYLAAGPLEDLIDFHPDSAIERIENEHPNDRLSAALREVFVGPWVNPDIVARLRRLAPELRYARDA